MWAACDRPTSVKPVRFALANDGVYSQRKIFPSTSIRVPVRCLLLTLKETKTKDCIGGVSFAWRHIWLLVSIGVSFDWRPLQTGGTHEWPKVNRLPSTLTAHLMWSSRRLVSSSTSSTSSTATLSCPSKLAEAFSETDGNWSTVHGDHFHCYYIYAMILFHYFTLQVGLHLEWKVYFIAFKV